MAQGVSGFTCPADYGARRPTKPLRINPVTPSAAILLDRLRAYDGRAVSMLGEIEADFGGEADYVNRLIALAAHQQAEVSSGATWLIKAALIKSALERGQPLSAPQTRKLCAHIPDITAWQAQLHICQSAGYLTIAQEDAAAIARWLKPLLTHDRPFLRAWSVDALCRIAAHHSKYAPAAREAVAAAGEDPAASVRARARKLVGVVG